MEKSAGRPKLSPKIGDEEKPSAVIHRPPCGPPQNPVWFPTIFTPIRDFRFFGRTQILSKVLKDFWKESPAHLENLRNDTQIFALECQNSARRARYLQNLPNLPTLKNLQNLRCRSAHCLQPVILVPLRGGGRSSERCSEGPDVLVYTFCVYCISPRSLC